MAGEEHAVGGAAGASAVAEPASDDAVEILDGVDLDLASFAAMSDRASASQWATRGVSHALLDMVRDVALLATGGDADAARFVSKPQWNRAKDEGGFELPSAERLRRKLDVEHWHQVLAVAFVSPKMRAGTLGSYRKRVSALSQGAAVPELQVDDAERELIEWYLATDEVFDGVEAPAGAGVGSAKPYRVGTGVQLASRDVMVRVINRALRAVAFRLGHSPTGLAYDHAIEAMEAEREAAGLPPLGFPGSETISSRSGSWSKGLEVAGLDPPPSHTRPKGLSVVLVLDEYIERNGVVPGWDCFRAWCAACQLSVEHRRTGGWDAIVAETRAVRAARGASTPEEIVRRKRDWPALPSPEQAAVVKEKLGGPRRIQRRRGPEEVREGIRIYKAEHLRPGQQPGTRHYQACCRRDPRLVWASHLKEITGKTFTGLCAEEGL